MGENVEANNYVCDASLRNTSKARKLSGVMPELVLGVEVEISQIRSEWIAFHGVPCGKAQRFKV